MNRLAASLFTVFTLVSGCLQAASFEAAQQLADSGNNPGAMREVTTFLAAHPEHAQARFLQALLQVRLGDSAAAIALFRKLADDYPDLPEPYNNLAVLYAADGDYESALEALQRAISTHQSYATAHENLGDLYARMAAEAYGKALSIDQSNHTAKSKLSLVTELFSVSTAGMDVASQAQPAAATAAPIPAVADAAVPAGLIERVKAWASAWSAQDVQGYLASYSKTFRAADGRDYAAWADGRRLRLLKPGYINVNVSDTAVTRIKDDRYAVTFAQSYESDSYRDQVRKRLLLVREQDKWLIASESQI